MVFMDRFAVVAIMWRIRRSGWMFWLEMLLAVVLMLGLSSILTSSSRAPVHAAPIDYSRTSSICLSGPSIRVHIHMHVSIYINNERVLIPGGVGIHVGRGRTCYYWLHTHDSSGVLHVEAPSQHTFVLGDFLTIWKQHFHQQGYPAQLDVTGWQVYVNGKPASSDFFHLSLSERMLVTLAYHSPNIQPDKSYNWPGNY